MSDAKKCDRCGEMITDETRQVRPGAADSQYAGRPRAEVPGLALGLGNNGWPTISVTWRGDLDYCAPCVNAVLVEYVASMETLADEPT